MNEPTTLIHNDRTYVRWGWHVWTCDGSTHPHGLRQRITDGLTLTSVRGIDCYWLFAVSALGYARLVAVDGRQLFASGGYRLIVLRNEVRGWLFEDGAKVPGHMARELEATYQEVRG